MRRGLAWGLTLPLAFAGSQAAHALAYELVYPQTHVRARIMLATGHSYLEYLPLVLGLAAAVALVALVVAGIDAARLRPARQAPAWSFALVAPTAFVLQEVLELTLHTGTFGWHAVFAPTFVPGLLLQLPFALTAYLVASTIMVPIAGIGCGWLWLRQSARGGDSLGGCRAWNLVPTLRITAKTSLIFGIAWSATPLPGSPC